MFKKILTTLTIGALALTSVFAADTYESGTLFYTNKAVDASDEYIATERGITVELMTADGTVIDTLEATAYYNLKNYGRTIERTTSGDSAALALLDQIYDGYVMTPFNDAVHSYDYDQVADETVDGVDCKVYEFELALDASAFFSGRRASGLVGWDGEDENGDVTAKVYVNASTGEIVKQVLSYTNGGLTYTQTASFTTEGGINVPSTVVTEGRIRTTTSARSISNVQYFKATESFSSYVEADGYHG